MLRSQLPCIANLEALQRACVLRGYVQLRSDHNRLNAHMHRKLKIVPSPMCPCGEEDQTTEHVLQICNRQQPERIAQWPSATPLHQKLYGGLEDLKKTTNFITAAGLVV